MMKLFIFSCILFIANAQTAICEVPTRSTEPAWLSLTRDLFLFGTDAAIGASGIPAPVDIVAGLIPGLSGPSSDADIDTLFSLAECLSTAVNRLHDRVNVLESRVDTVQQNLCGIQDTDQRFQLAAIELQVKNIQDKIGTISTSVCGIMQVNGEARFVDLGPDNPCDNVYYREDVINPLTHVFQEIAQYIAIVRDRLACFECNEIVHEFTYKTNEFCQCSSYGSLQRCNAGLPLIGPNPGYCETIKQHQTNTVTECMTKWDSNSYTDGFYEPVVNVVNMAMNVWAEATMIGRERDEIDFDTLVEESRIMNTFVLIPDELAQFRMATSDHDYWKTGGTNSPNSDDPSECGDDLTPGYIHQFQSSDRDGGTSTATCIRNPRLALESITENLDAYEDSLRDIYANTLGIDPSCEKCPEGVCDRDSNGNCKIYNNGYHCHLGPEGVGCTHENCFVYHGNQYFTWKRSNANINVDSCYTQQQATSSTGRRSLEEDEDGASFPNLDEFFTTGRASRLLRMFE